MESLFSIELSDVVHHLAKLAIAFVLALPIAWDREKASGKRLGLRTFPLVSMASCGYILIGSSVLEGDAVARIVQGLITGIGFLGGGAIVKRGLDVHGTATAASIWATAAIGAAVAFTRYEIAVALAIATFISLSGLKPLKDKIKKGKAEYEDDEDDEADEEGGDDPDEEEVVRD